MMEPLTETEIIKRVLEGQKPLYELIVRRFNAQLYKIGRAYNFNHEDTQDLMQDTYVDAYKCLAQFEKRASFKTWLMRIMLNHCYHKKQKFSFKNETAMDSIQENLNPMFSPSSNDGQKTIQSHELGQIIEHSLSKIPESYRMVFALREINGLNVAETSSLLGITESNVKVRLNRAKAMLRKEIEKSYSNEELFEFNLRYCDPFTERTMQIIYDL